ncbi:hypothetical protein Bbelb_012750 [Branchiostoma belcheri]|nr:hypothetical protein Bbelb_012750 [Branchiostoma belcheri]
MVRCQGLGVTRLLPRRVPAKLAIPIQISLLLPAVDNLRTFLFSAPPAPSPPPAAGSARRGRQRIEPAAASGRATRLLAVLITFDYLLSGSRVESRRERTAAVSEASASDRVFAFADVLHLTVQGSTMGIFALLVVTLVVAQSKATPNASDWKRSLFQLVSPEDSDGSDEVPSHQSFTLLPDASEYEEQRVDRKSRAAAAALFRPPNRFGRSPAMWLDSPNRFGRSARFSVPFDIPRRFGRGYSLDSDVPRRFGRAGNEEEEETSKKNWSMLSFQRPFRFGRASATTRG